MKNKKLKITSIIIIICVVAYLLDRFVFVVNDADMGITGTSIQIAGKSIEEMPFLMKILGTNWGKLYYIMAVPPILEAPTKIWQPFTYLFMHQFLFHLIFNMIALYIIGTKVESKEGSLYTTCAFIIIGIVGLFITNIIANVSNAYTVGSSIAVFGLIGIGVSEIIIDKSFIKQFKKIAIIYMIIYGLLLTYTSGTWTMVAHNTGLVLGIATHFIYYYAFAKKRKA